MMLIQHWIAETKGKREKVNFQTINNILKCMHIFCKLDTVVKCRNYLYTIYNNQFNSKTFVQIKLTIKSLK